MRIANEILSRRGRNILSGVRSAVDQVSIGHLAPFHASKENGLSTEYDNWKPTSPDISDAQKKEIKPISRP